jgi:prepilin-type N-terminal cleavage/methylation domain-containing protein
LARAASNAFTLIEITFSVAIVSILIVGLYTAIATSVSWVGTCQENQRVTQILSEKLDTIRLYNWDQVNSNGFIPTNFTLPFDPIKSNSVPYYTGTVSIAMAPSPLDQRYSSNLLRVVVKVDWVAGSRPQSRSMETFVAKYGLQSYIMR